MVMRANSSRSRRHPASTGSGYCDPGPRRRRDHPSRQPCKHRSAIRAFQQPKRMPRFADICGATAIEYGLIAAGISVVIIAAVNAIGSSLNAKFDYIANQLK